MGLPLTVKIKKSMCLFHFSVRDSQKEWKEVESFAHTPYLCLCLQQLYIQSMGNNCLKRFWFANATLIFIFLMTFHCSFFFLCTNVTGNPLWSLDHSLFWIEIISLENTVWECALILIWKKNREGTLYEISIKQVF